MDAGIATAVPPGDRIARLSEARRRARLVWPTVNARLRLRSATAVGRRVTLRGRPVVTNEGRMIIGDRVRLLSTVATLELVTIGTGQLEIGNNVFVNYGSSLVASSRVTIGNDCLIGAHVTVMDCDFHRVEDKGWDTTGEPIVIEERVWLGNRAMVLKGVRVGHDAVVAAGAVVTRDVEPRTLVAGVPAVMVKRF